MILPKKLQQLNFSEKEAKVYTSLLELGQATPQQISAKSGINRATTYVLLEGLIEKGLASSIVKEKKAFFSVENPLQILDMLYKEKELVDNKISIAKKIMPELEMLERLTGERVKVRFFEGKDGIQLIQKDVARTKVDYFDSIFNINLSLDIFPLSPTDHRQVLKRRFKRARTIIIYDPKIPVPNNLPIYYKEQRRFLPNNKFKFLGDFSLYANKLALISLKTNLIGVVIENKDIVESYKSLFNLAWEGSEKYKSIIGLKQKKKKKEI